MYMSGFMKEKEERNHKKIAENAAKMDKFSYLRMNKKKVYYIFILYAILLFPYIFLFFYKHKHTCTHIQVKYIKKFLNHSTYF